MARYFEFIKNGKQHVFSGATPRDAALKAATRFGTKGSPNTMIELREHGKQNKDGTYSLHRYKVGYKESKPRAGAPSWLGSKAKEGLAKKVGVRRVKKIPKP